MNMSLLLSILLTYVCVTIAVHHVPKRNGTEQFIAFLTFGGGGANFHQRVVEVCSQAKSLNFFHRTHCMTDANLRKDVDFWSKHGPFIEANRQGYGFWIWKVYFIRRLMHKMYPNDILVYMDVGCHFNPNGMPRMHEYIAILNSNDIGILSFQLEHMEKKYTKRALLEYMQPPEDHITSNQFMATVVLLKKTNHSMNFIEDWYNLATSHYELINNDRRSDEFPEFIDHRHDQSMYSLMVKKHGTNGIKDETWFPYPGERWPEVGGKYPIWARRDKK